MKPFISWKLFLRWLLASLLYYSFALNLYLRFRKQKQPVILTYHRIIEQNEYSEFIQPGMCVSSQTFKKHLRYLKRHYQVVTMKQLMAWRERPEKLSPTPCAITFDDGWSDNYDNALPLLRRYQCPATLFIATDFIGTGRTPWFYQLPGILYALSMISGDHHALSHIAEQNVLPLVLSQWLQSKSHKMRLSFDNIIEKLKQLHADELEHIKEQLLLLLQISGQSITLNNSTMLDWRQIHEMKSNGVEFGSHTCSHAILTQTSREDQERELTESKRLIETQLQQRIEGFCYPNGNFDDEIIELVKAAGYSFACTTQTGCVDACDDSFSLKRVGVHDDITFSTALFACHIAGVFNRN